MTTAHAYFQIQILVLIDKIPTKSNIFLVYWSHNCSTDNAQPRAPPSWRKSSVPPHKTGASKAAALPPEILYTISYTSSVRLKQKILDSLILFFFFGWCLLQFKLCSAPRKTDLSLSSSTFIRLYLYMPHSCLRTKDTLQKSKFFRLVSSVTLVQSLLCFHQPTTSIFTHAWLEIRPTYRSIYTQKAEVSCI